MFDGITILLIVTIHLCLFCDSTRQRTTHNLTSISLNLEYSAKVFITFPINCLTSVRMIMMGVLGWNLNLYPPAYLCWRLSQVNLRACRCWVADSNPTSVDTAFNLQSLTHVTSSVIIECPGSSTMATELVVAPSSEIKGQLKKKQKQLVCYKFSPFIDAETPTAVDSPSWQTYTCTDEAYHCENPYGNCMPANWQCDGVADCYNGQDEENCGKVKSKFLMSRIIDQKLPCFNPVSKLRLFCINDTNNAAKDSKHHIYSRLEMRIEF